MRAETCPSDYALDKDSFKKVININNSTLYIVGGLYGNIESLKEINKMIEKDKDILLIFNGDMHWFDKSADDFKKIEDMSENSQKLLGNVEKELFREGDYNGCGCSYPSYVSDDIVNRSNIIHKELKKVMDILPKYKNILSGRKKNITVEMMGQKIAITHGDEKSLSGWECSNESLERDERQNELDNWFIENDIDMSGVNWKPIYPEASAREYTVDGNGHTLRNFTIDGEFGAIYVYSALGGLIKIEYNAYTGIWGKFDGLMKDITFENISINGLANDEVHTDVDGNPIDHSKEYAYFTGVVGYTGGNQWSMSSKFENVHVKHMHIQSSASSQNLGGLVGWVGSGGGGVGNRSVSFKNCTATDIHLRGYQAGGLVGQILGDRGAQFENCSTEDIYIRYHSISQSSGFIGNIGDGGLTISFYAAIEINNCTPATHVEYIRDSTGEKLDYTPQSPYYGHKNDGDVVTITPAETTEP